MRISCVGGGVRWAGLSSVSVRTPLRALSNRRERRCNAPALRFPTSVLRFHLRRFAHPSGGLMKWELCLPFNSKTGQKWGTPHPGLGQDTWQPGARGLGGWGGHAGLPKITKFISSDTGKRK
eukprot:gene19559-biopygen22049